MYQNYRYKLKNKAMISTNCIMEGNHYFIILIILLVLFLYFQYNLFCKTRLSGPLM